MWHFLLSIDCLDLVESVKAGREAAVHAEDLVVDHCREREEVEDLRTVAPDVDAPVLAEAFIVEAVDLRHAARLVVAADERDPLRVADLECEQKQERLDRVEAAIDKVSHEDVISLRALTADAEQLHKVVELSVYVAADRDRCADGLDV